jgi:zinc protease
VIRLFWVLPWFILSCTGKKYDPGPRAFDAALAPVRLVLQPAKGPKVWMQVTVRAGSAHDPVGKEGLAHLTAQLLREGGMGEMAPQDVSGALLELGTDIEVVVDKELVSFRIQCARQDALRAATLLGLMFKAPQFQPKVLDRLKAEGIDWLDRGVLGSDEQLGDEVFQSWLYQGHPYGHPITGRSGVIGSIGVADVIAFYSERYVRPVMAVGVAGGVEDRVVSQLVADLSLAEGKLYRGVTPRPVGPVLDRSMLIVTKETPGTGVQFGHPTGLGRDHKDWPAMMVAVAALGEHREFNGNRNHSTHDQRGLNQGEFASVEALLQVHGIAAQQPGTGRVDNSFSVLIRPTTPDQAAFALKGALDIVERWVADGLTPEEFERSKAQLQRRIARWAEDAGRRIAWALEAQVMGWPNPMDTLSSNIGALNIEAVNGAIQTHIDPKRLRIVVVTEDAEAFEEAINGNKLTSLDIPSGAPGADPALVAEDARISGLSLGIGEVNRVAAAGVFR